LKKGFQEISKHILDVDMSIADFAKFNVKLREAKVDEDELIDMALRYPETLAKSKNVYFAIMFLPLAVNESKPPVFSLIGQTTSVASRALTMSLQYPHLEQR
jgi:hypothetical protein